MPTFEVEPNNSSASATALPLSSVISGQLASSNDLDFYKVTVSAAGELMGLAIDLSVNSQRSVQLLERLVQTPLQPLVPMEPGQLRFSKSDQSAFFYLSRNPR